MFLASSALDLVLLIVMLIDFIIWYEQNSTASTVVSIFLNSLNESENITTLYLLAYLEIQSSVIYSAALYDDFNNSVPVTTNTKYVYDVD